MLIKTKEPETNFPIQPKNRWRNWQGTLNEGDEVYIFSRDVCEHLISVAEQIGRKDGLNNAQIEEIVQYIFKHLFEYYSKLTRGDIFKKTIQKDLASHIFKAFLIVFRHCKHRYIFSKKDRIPFQTDKLDQMIDQALEYNETLDENLQVALYDCISHLPEFEQLVIELQLDGLPVREISKILMKTPGVINKAKILARNLLKKCLNQKGYTGIEDEI